MSGHLLGRLGVALYRVATTLATPLVRRHLARRQARGREDGARIGERFGYAGAPRPAGPLLWVHGASVGESLSVLPLLRRIRTDWPDLTILMTSGTVTSAKLMAERLPEGVRHQFVPVDTTAAVTRFLDHWQPDLALFLEGEIWPNLLTLTRAHGTPLALVNGRMSPKSFRSWQRTRPVIRHLLAQFDLVLAQSAEDQAHFEAFGADPVRLAGNLKFAAPPLAADEAELQRLKAETQGRPLWLAASTHPGEEEQVAAVHNAVAAAHDTILTVLAPRHPTRGDEIADLLKALGLRVALRSKGDPLTAEHDVYLVDTIGEMGLWFRLCGIVFIGKSLVPKGGQNPIEAALLDCAVLSGPHTANFTQITREMEQAGALLRVADDAALADAVARLLADTGERDRLAAAAKSYAEQKARCLDDIAAALTPLLDRAAQVERESGAQ